MSIHAKTGLRIEISDKVIGLPDSPWGLTQQGILRTTARVMCAPLGILQSFLLIGLAALIQACDPAQLPPACKIPGALPGDLKELPELVLSEENLAPLLFRGNTPIHIASLGVRQAKAEVNLARAELLPSIRLGALLLSAGQPQFAWTAVESALPFLIPSNWFRAGQAAKLFQAEKFSLQIVEQNQFAQAHSLIRLWQVDRELDAHLEDEKAEALIASERITRSFALGLVTPEEKNRAQAWALDAQAASVQMKELLAKEEAALRRVFGVTASIPVVSQGIWGEVASSDSELRSGEAGVETIVGEAMSVAPEALQLDALIEASKSARWASIFGFVGGGSLQLNADSSGGLTPSFSSLSAGAGLSFGVSLFPTIQLSQLQIREMELRKMELKQEIRQTLEGLKAQLDSSRAQLDLAVEREKALRSTLQSVSLRLSLGIATLAEREAAEGAWRESLVNRLRATSELSLSRLSWQRVMQEGPFAELSPCLVTEK